MSLSIKGKLIKVLDVQAGTSKAGKDWVKQEFVIDTGAAFNPEICFNLFGSDKIALLSGTIINQELDVSFNVSSREFNGKYYHNLDAWKIQLGDLLSNEPIPEQGTEEDDLPF
jgi:hypothetical protein